MGNYLECSGVNQSRHAVLRASDGRPLQQVASHAWLAPQWTTEHVFVGAGDGPRAILAVGSRSGGNVIAVVSYLDGWLPG